MQLTFIVPNHMFVTLRVNNDHVVFIVLNCKNNAVKNIEHRCVFAGELYHFGAVGLHAVYCAVIIIEITEVIERVEVYIITDYSIAAHNIVAKLFELRTVVIDPLQSGHFGMQLVMPQAERASMAVSSNTARVFFMCVTAFIKPFINIL